MVVSGSWVIVVVCPLHVVGSAAINFHGLSMVTLMLHKAVTTSSVDYIIMTYYVLQDMSYPIGIVY